MALQISNDLSAVEDSYLATQGKAGDEAAFRQLFDKHHGWVYNKAYRMLGNCCQNSEDIVADVFVYIWEKRDKLDPERGDFKAWLHTVTQRFIEARTSRDAQTAYTT